MADFYGHLLGQRFRAGGRVAVQPLKWVQGSVFAEIAITETVQLGGVGLGVTPGTNMLNIVPSQNTYKGIQVKGASGQSGALLDLRDNSDNKVLEVLAAAFGVFDVSPAAQQVDMGVITDNSGGSADATIEAFAGDYAALSVEGNGSATSVTLSSTFYQFTGFDTDGPESISDADHTNDHVVIGATGTYVVVGCFSIEGSASDVCVLQAQKNDGATALTQLTTEAVLDASGNTTDVGFCNLVDFTLNDTLELWLKNDTDTDDITVKHAQLFVLRIDDNTSIANNFADFASRANSIRALLRLFGFMA